MPAEREQSSPYPTDTMQITIEKRSIDDYNHVNYGQYPRFFRDAFVSYLLNRDITIDGLHEMGIEMVVQDMHVRYKKPLHEGDTPTIFTRVKMHETGFVFHQKMENDGVITTTSEVEFVTIDQEGRIPLPGFLREKLLRNIPNHKNPEE